MVLFKEKTKGEAEKGISITLYSMTDLAMVSRQIRRFKIGLANEEGVGGILRVLQDSPFNSSIDLYGASKKVLSFFFKEICSTAIVDKDKLTISIFKESTQVGTIGSFEAFDYMILFSQRNDARSEFLKMIGTFGFTADTAWADDKSMRYIRNKFLKKV